MFNEDRQGEKVINVFQLSAIFIQFSFDAVHFSRWQNILFEL